MKKTLLLITANTFFMVLLCCFASAQGFVNLSFEDARTIGKGGFDIKAIYEHPSLKANGITGSLGNHYGGIIGFGVTSNFDIKARYEKLVPPAEGGSGNNDFFSLVPKYSVANGISFLLPLSLYSSTNYGQTFKMYSVAPNFLVTVPVMKNEANVTASMKGDFLFQNGEKTQGLLGFNLGAGLSNDLSAWALRPEVGYIFKPGEEGRQWTWGLSLQLLFGKKGTK